jgi:AraC-like DNA-binding protein
MKSEPENANERGVREDGRLPSRRKTELLQDGAYLFQDELDGNGGELSLSVITCEAWLLELIELQAGELFFSCGNETVRPSTKRFGIFYPPFSITQLCFRNPQGRLLGIAATATVPEAFTAAPTVFELPVIEIPHNIAQVIEILQCGRNRQTVEAYPKPSLLSRKAKRLIDQNYMVYPSIARVAARVGVTHEHLTRQFKLDFGMTPSAYLRQLRLADVPLRLARNEAIINISHDVGYNDLSRFYKQFRKTTNTSPGACKTIMRTKRGRETA